MSDNGLVTNERLLSMLVQCSCIMWDMECGFECNPEYDIVRQQRNEARSEILHRLETLEATVAEYKPYYDALHSRHNGYDPEARRELGMREPKTPKHALDSLIGEAEGLGITQGRMESAERIATLEAENERLRRVAEQRFREDCQKGK